MNNQDEILKLSNEIQNIIKRNNLEIMNSESKNAIKRNIVNEILDLLETVEKDEN